MGEQVDRLARFVAESRWDEIPESVREHARLVLLDTLGVILVGSGEAEVGRLSERLLAGGGSGATVLRTGFPTADPRTAALLNGLAGRSVELCEGHRFVSCQAAVQLLPTVLALGEQHGSDGAAVLSALVLGYEVAVRVGAAATARSLAHQNGQAPLLGAVAAGARLRGFDATLTARALQIGANLVLTPSYRNVVAGGTSLNAVGGMSGFAGVLASELALAGFTAASDALEGAFAGLVGDGFAPERLIDGLGAGWEITHNYFRLRGCCNPIYSALDALEAALAELRPAPDEIERIEVETYRFASVMCQQQPVNHFAAKYSLPHAAAALAVLGTTGFRAFTAEAVADPVIAALRDRVFVAEDPALSAVVPRLKPARVRLTLRDGRRTTRLCESARGDFQQPYGRAELEAKFRDLAGTVLPPDGVERLASAVGRLGPAGGVRELVELARTAGR